MREWLEDLEWRIRDLFEHSHSYKLVTCGIYVGEKCRRILGVPVVAWKYRCKCGDEIIEYDSSGIELLQKGLNEEEVVSTWI